MLVPNGLELSCPAARATAHSFSRILAAKSRSNFPLASRVSCSELFGGENGCSRLAEEGSSVDQGLRVVLVIAPCEHRPDVACDVTNALARIFREFRNDT
jgi:hypothetical protein